MFILCDNCEVLTNRSFMTETIMPLSKAVEGYELFNNMKAHKVIFDADE